MTAPDGMATIDAPCVPTWSARYTRSLPKAAVGRPAGEGAGVAAGAAHATAPIARSPKSALIRRRDALRVRAAALALALGRPRYVVVQRARWIASSARCAITGSADGAVARSPRR